MRPIKTISYSVYISIDIYLGYNICLLKIHFYLKDVLLWFVFVGVPFCYNSVERKLPEKYFLKGITENLKFIVLVEYVTGTYTFNFIIELILQPLIAFLALTSAVAEKDEKNKAVKKFVDALLAIIGLLILGFSIKELIVSFDTIIYQDVLFELLSPLVLSVLFLPFSYGFAIYSKYQIIFLRMKIMEITAFKNRFSIVKQCGLSYKKLNFYAGRVGTYFYRNITDAEYKNAIDKINGEFKNQ